MVVLDPDSESSSKVLKVIPLLKERGLVDNLATAYVCHNFACQLPVTDPTAFGRNFSRLRPHLPLRDLGC